MDSCVSSVLENVSEFHLVLFSPSWCADSCPSVLCMGVLAAVLFVVGSEVPGS